MPTTAVRRDLLVDPLERVRRADPAAVQLGEREVREQVGLGIGEQPGNGRHARLERGDDAGARVARRCLVGLLEHGPRGRGEAGDLRTNRTSVRGSPDRTRAWGRHSFRQGPDRAVLGLR